MLPNTAIIVARLGSTRLQCKPLISIDGRTLVQQAIDAALAAACFDEVIIAS